jgi:hypothetical protein
MNQTPEEQPAQPATARAEALLGNLGRRFDRFTAQAGQRMHNAATSIREEADQMDQPATGSGEQAHGPRVARTEEEGKLAMERAEEFVDRVSHRLGHYLALGTFQAKRTTSRLREEGEDMWAEAQSIRQKKSRPSQ